MSSKREKRGKIKAVFREKLTHFNVNDLTLISRGKTQKTLSFQHGSLNTNFSAWDKHDFKP